MARIAVVLGVRGADGDLADTLRRDELVVVPHMNDVYLLTYLLYKLRRFGMPELVQRLSPTPTLARILVLMVAPSTKTWI